MLPCQKHLFALPEQLHYLNCAYMGPLPHTVQEAGIQGIRRKANPAGIQARDFFTDSDALRERFARLLRVPEPNRVAILPAVSYGIATVARNTRCERGQNIVIAGEQFPSNVYAWRSLTRHAGLEVRVVDPPVSERRGEEWNAALLRAVDASTAVVALPQVHWTDGTRFDLHAIGTRTREVGAALVIDATQSLGAHPFDATEIGADAVICAGYKWLLGPYSIALGWFGPRYDRGEPLEETWIARAGSDDFQKLIHYRDEYEPGAVRFDVGERSNFILVPMLLAALDQVLEWGAERVQAYCARLMAGTVEEARALGFRVEDEAWRGAHIIGFRVPPGMDLQALQESLHAARVFASLRGSALRVSPHVYNDDGDTQALRAVLRAATPLRGVSAGGIGA